MCCRVGYFNQAALAAEDLLSDANPKAVHSAHKLLASLDKLQCCPEHAAKVGPKTDLPGLCCLGPV